MGAHYDSTSSDPNNAPGATDNGGGVAIVLEFARIMSKYRFNHTLIFACWNAEEDGHLGSDNYTKYARSNSLNISLYINFDSACYDPDNKLILDIMYNSNSLWVSDMMTQYNSLYGINFTLTYNVHDCGSDHEEFWLNGYTAVMTHEQIHGPAHTPSDTIEKVSTLYAKKNGQLGMSVLAKLAEVWHGGIISPNVGDFLSYNITATYSNGDIRFVNVTLNLTFSEHPYGAEDLFNVTVQCSDWEAFSPGADVSENGASIVLNITSRFWYNGTSPFNDTDKFPAYFPFMIPIDISIGSEIPMGIANASFNLTVIRDENVTLYGEQYSCWNASGDSLVYGMYDYLFWKSSGITLYLNVHSPYSLESSQFYLIETRVGEFSVISEFSTFLILPIFMIVTLLAVIIHRRKRLPVRMPKQ